MKFMLKMKRSEPTKRFSNEILKNSMNVVQRFELRWIKCSSVVYNAVVRIVNSSSISFHLRSSSTEDKRRMLSEPAVWIERFLAIETCSVTRQRCPLCVGDENDDDVGTMRPAGRAERVDVEVNIDSSRFIQGKWSYSGKNWGKEALI